MRKVLKFLLIFSLILGLLYLLGPRPATPTLSGLYPEVATNLAELERNINAGEAKVANLRPDNQARIIWQDSSRREATEYSVVYLHGFSASYYEGYPINQQFAQRYGCNLYLPRLAGHGIEDKDAFLEVSPDKLMQSAREALAVGNRLGEKVILMCTSTGATLGLYLAAEHPDKVHALIIYSPLIDFYHSALDLLDKPWGLQIARTINQDYYQVRKDIANEQVAQYWTNKFRLEGAVMLKNLVAHSMLPETFSKVKQPLFLGYYYKDEEHQDQTVSVAAMRKMFKQLGTPDSLKQQSAFPKAGHHVIASRAISRDIEGVRQATYEFADKVLGLKAIDALEPSEAE